MLRNFMLSSMVGMFALLSNANAQLVDLVNPFLGTAPLTDSKEIGYEPPAEWRVWAGLVFPGSSVPNAMVQLSPITEFHSGAGYEYEDDTIYAFTHTNKGHWNLCHIPFMPVSGEFTMKDFGSVFSHDNETASPGYYRVLLDRYGINAELTSSLRCGYHKYTYSNAADRKLIVNLGVSNERVRDWDIKQQGDFAFIGFQNTGSKVCFYAKSNTRIKEIQMMEQGRWKMPVIIFEKGDNPVEVKIGLSFVSQENAQKNLVEIEDKSFEKVHKEAVAKWEELLGKVKVTGGSERQKELFYSSLYRSFLWPALRSDINGEFTDESGKVENKGFNYYTRPSLWDTYRNKLVLLGLLSPEVTNDVIKSLIDMGEKRGFMPTFFHGDHAAAFISGSYLRGLRDYNVDSAYQLLLNNATKEGGTRPHISEYIEKGYISTPEIEAPHVETKAKAGVTKTLEYAYDDYAVALLAKALGDDDNYQMLMKRTKNYKNLFDSSTGLMRGKLEDGSWVKNFDSEYPYYEYMYREANAWQSTFFAPHDTEGLVALFDSKTACEKQLDKLFTIPWNPDHIARNVSSFIGQYCHGNQPDHSTPYVYYFVGKQEKSQKILNELMEDFYGMGEDGLALCGMDDAGEMSSWYVFNAMGFYPYSPADDSYIVTVPLFDKVDITLSGDQAIAIEKKNNNEKIGKIICGTKPLSGYFIKQSDMLNKKVTIETIK